MQSRKLGLAVAALAAAAAIVLFVVLREDDSDSGGSTATTPAAQPPAGNGPAPGPGGGQGQPKGTNVPTIVVRDGRPVGGVQELTFEKGGRIGFIVESDVADEVHLHGYDIAKVVDAGGSVKFDVPASIEGVFEVELEQRVVPLAEVTVNP
ncbi:MAG: hypothetical protein AABM42_09590 [Actinomycetota bacterium]